MTLVEELADRRIGLGTASFAFGTRSREDCIATVIAAVDAGVHLIDTAKAYTRSGEETTAESILGAALREVGRDRVLVATKGGHWRSGDDFPINGGRAALREHCTGSLRALGVDVIDLYQLHHVDPLVPLEDSVHALAELQQEGLVRYLGLSNVSAAQLEVAGAVAEISAVQNKLSVNASADADFAQQCAAASVAYLAYSPLGGVGAPTSERAAQIARDRGSSTQAVMIAWVLAQSSTTVPLVGATRPQTIQDSARARHLQLSAEEIASLVRQ